MTTTARKTTLILLLATALTSVGCGKQAFNPAEISEAQSSPGTYTIAPKVDILLAQDDTGSMSNGVYTQLTGQVKTFLAGLDSQGWDYRFATTPLTRPRSMTQILASKYDGNWAPLGLWLPPFPGADPNDSGYVNSTLFRTPSTYTGYLTSYDNRLSGSEPGLQTIVDALKNKASAVGFLRPDAMTVVLTIGNGNDTSLVNYCNSGTQVVPCEILAVPTCTSYAEVIAGGCKSAQWSYNYFKSQLQTVTPNPSQLKFYAAVAGSSTSSTGQTCLGGGAYAGTRYRNMAYDLGGQAYDVCTTPISTVLTDLQNSLHIQRLGFRTHYLFVSQEPDPSSISVTVTRASGAVEEIAEDPYNGYTYVGYIPETSPVYRIDSPYEMNLGWGYAIELHGSARLIGDDNAKVTYQLNGSQTTVEN